MAKIEIDGLVTIDLNPEPRKPKNTPMTDQRYQLILNFIREYRRVKGFSPKYEEIAVGIGYAQSAAGTVFTHVQNLIAEGWLKQLQPGARMVVLTERAQGETYAEITDSDLKRIAKQQRNLRILRRL